jgi:hypothetical protein
MDVRAGDGDRDVFARLRESDSSLSGTLGAGMRPPLKAGERGAKVTPFDASGDDRDRESDSSPSREGTRIR